MPRAYVKAEKTTFRCEGVKTRFFSEENVLSQKTADFFIEENCWKNDAGRIKALLLRHKNDYCGACFGSHCGLLRPATAAAAIEKAQ